MKKIILSYIKNNLTQFPALSLLHLRENNYSCTTRSVDISFRLQTRQTEELCFSCRQEKQMILFFKNAGTLGSTQHAFHSEEGALSQRMKLLVREVYNIPSCRTAVKNRWSFYFSPPICLRNIHRDDFTFNFSAVGICQLI
jgi:hypothetical protein